MKMSVYKIYTNVRASLWLIPVLCVLLGVGFSLATLAIDHAYDYKLVPEWMVGGPDAAMNILTTVATSMVSLTALVLTIVLVAVQLAMGQFSPRIVQRLLRDRPSQFAIGLFVATFVHSLMALRHVILGSGNDPGQVPGVAMLGSFLLAFASIAVLVMYVHHVGQALRVSALVELAGDETRKLLDKVYPDLGPPTAASLDRTLVLASESGVVATVGHRELVKVAQRGDCVLELVPALGEYVPKGGVLFRIAGNTALVDRKKVSNGVILQLERTLDQDVAYGLRLLVDMAERSLSDSRFQDPTTAVQSIDRLHDCLRQLVSRPLPDGRYYDDGGQLRLVEHVMTWEAYVQLTFTELRLAGAGSPQVARRLHAALLDLIDVAPDDRRAPLETELQSLQAEIGERFGSQADTTMARTPDAGGLTTRVN